MKVKIGNTVYSGEDQPIMVILTEEDKENIGRMSPNATMYAEAPDGTAAEEIDEWMRAEVGEEQIVGVYEI